MSSWPYPKAADGCRKDGPALSASCQFCHVADGAHGVQAQNSELS